MALSHVLLLLGAYVVLSSLANALDPNDRTVFGTVRRFLLNLTNSPIVVQALHVPANPTQFAPSPLTALNLNK